MTTNQADLFLYMRQSLEGLEETPDDLVGQLIPQVEKILRQQFGLTYAQCDLLLCDLRRDLSDHVQTFLRQQRRMAEYELQALCDEIEAAP